MCMHYMYLYYYTLALQKQHNTVLHMRTRMCTVAVRMCPTRSVLVALLTANGDYCYNVVAIARVGNS